MQDDTTQTTDASLSECGNERFERNHYFHGKLMTARDMQAEQAYNVGQRRAQARNVGGSGVAWGLKAEITGEGDESIRVFVHEGYGVDACGRPIVMPDTYDDVITDGSKVDAPALSVYLEYDACLKESVPVDGGETACEDECAYNRVLEVYDVHVKAHDPDPTTVGKPIEPVTFPDWNDLDSVSDSDRSLPGEYDPVYATIASSYWDEVGAPGGAEAAADGLYLGTFATDDNGNWQREPAPPTQYLYTNDMLYAGLARHTADFGNPHETSLRTVTRESASETGLQVRDDGSDNPQVVVSSTDETVEVTHTPDAQQIDLSVQRYVEEVVAERIEPLERYAVERALKYKALVFDRAAERFDGEAGGTAGDIASLAREAVDTRLASTGGADGDGMIELGGGGDQSIHAEDYVALLTEFLDLEEEFRTQVDGQVTEASYQRLSNAIGRLKAALEPADPSTLDIGAAEDDVADAVEWLAELEEEPEPEPADATFTDGGQFEEHRGDIAEITVELENTRSATLTVGSAEGDYQSTVDIQSGGGRSVTVQMNTFLAGRGASEESRAFGTANPADSASATLQSAEHSGMLTARTYEVSLAVEGEEAAVGTLELLERGTEGLQVSRSPAGSYDSLTSPAAIRSARSAGDIDDGDVESGDVVVAEIGSTGIYGAIAAASGDATVVDGRAIEGLEHRELMWIDIVQAGARTSAGKRLRFWQSVERGAARALADPAAERVYLVIDTAQAVVIQPDGNRASLGPGETYTVEFNLGAGSPLSSDAEQVSDDFSMAGRRLVEVPDVEGDSYTAASMKASEQQLSLDPTYKQIQSANTLSVASYDYIDQQDRDPGTEVPAGTEIGVEVWTSRPVADIEGIDPQILDQLANMDIEYVHELEETDTAQLTNNIAGVGTQTATNLKNEATDYRIADELAVREGTNFQDSLQVSSTFRESGQTDVTNLDDGTIQTMLTNAVQDPNSSLTAADAGTFFEGSQTFNYTIEDLQNNLNLTGGSSNDFITDL